MSCRRVRHDGKCDGYYMDVKEEWLCLLVKRALTTTELSAKEQEQLALTDIGSILNMADTHKVLQLLYDLLMEPSVLPEGEKNRLQFVAESTVRQSYRLLFLTGHLTNKLEQAGIPVLVLKGSGAAVWYPVPEYRKSGDIDLCFQDKDSALAALSLLQEEGWYRKQKEHAHHHICCCNSGGIDVELHIRLAEVFDNRELNEKLEELLPVFMGERIYRDVMGITLPVLADACQAFQLLLHMLHHFLRSGFGLKLLCDWVVFWNQMDGETALRFRSLASDCGLEGFARAVTLVCEKYLGLEENKVYPSKEEGGADTKEYFPRDYGEKLMLEILEAGEFGAAGDRMVALRKKSLAGYCREFHHQMRINYAKESKKVFMWPVLWTKTLIGFIRNNKRFHRASLRGILKKAGERAELVEKMRLFERQSNG